MEEHRAQVNKLIGELAVHPKSPVISKEKYDQIVNHLKQPTVKVDSHFKAWVKKRQYQLLDVPGLGLQDALQLPNSKAKGTSYTIG